MYAQNFMVWGPEAGEDCEYCYALDVCVFTQAALARTGQASFLHTIDIFYLVQKHCQWVFLGEDDVHLVYQLGLWRGM